MLIVMVLMGPVMLMMMRRSVCHLGCWGGEVHCDEIAPGVPARDQVHVNKDDGHKDGDCDDQLLTMVQRLIVLTLC